MFDRVRPGGPALAVLAGTSLMALWWGTRGLLPEASARRGLVGVIERSAGLAWRGHLPARSALAGIARGGLTLGAPGWLARLADGEPERGARLILGIEALVVWAGFGMVGGLAAAARPGLAGVAAVAVTVAALGLPAQVALAARGMRRRLKEQVPLALELLAVGLGAGEPLERVLGATAAELAPPLRSTLARAAARVAAGERAGLALRREAQLCGVAVLERVASTVERGATLGLPLDGPLHALAADLRAAWRSTLLARAGRATPMAALLTALVIAPACVAALAVCLVGAAVVQGGVLG
ncbi:MAG: type II secretion system F family protein [Candidatus Dormibacteria bacterium]